MSKIVVFDSGLGSLSIIKPIQRVVKSDIIYFADQKNFPYGTKSRLELETIIKDRILMLDELFLPDFIVLGSNTPTLLLPHIIRGNIIGVTPPLKKAARTSKTKNIAILGTKSVIHSTELSEFIASARLSKNTSVFKTDASDLVKLVEHGVFVDDIIQCKRKIKKTLQTITKNDIDVACLSSTHLPFLKNILKDEFPAVKFLDPGNDVARVVKRKSKTTRKRNRLTVFTSSDPRRFQDRLATLGIYNKVRHLC